MCASVGTNSIRGLFDGEYFWRDDHHAQIANASNSSIHRCRQNSPKESNVKLSPLIFYAVRNAFAESAQTAVTLHKFTNNEKKPQRPGKIHSTVNELWNIISLLLKIQTN